MKIRALVLATTILTAATGVAFAQSSPAPVNQSGGGIDAAQSPTDMGIAGQTGLTKGTPTRGAVSAQRQQMAPAATTGSGLNSPARESAHKAASPASPDAGIKQEK
jgi:hypothetical protein